MASSHTREYSHIIGGASLPLMTCVFYSYSTSVPTNDACFSGFNLSNCSYVGSAARGQKRTMTGNPQVCPQVWMEFSALRDHTAAFTRELWGAHRHAPTRTPRMA